MIEKTTANPLLYSRRVARQLLICPKCESGGKREVLGEIDGNGNFIVLRQTKQIGLGFRGNQNTNVANVLNVSHITIIKSTEFLVECGVCGEEVFYRNKT